MFRYTLWRWLLLTNWHYTSGDYEINEETRVLFYYQLDENGNNPDPDTIKKFWFVAERVEWKADAADRIDYAILKLKENEYETLKTIPRAVLTTALPDMNDTVIQIHSPIYNAGRNITGYKLVSMGEYKGLYEPDLEPFKRFLFTNDIASVSSGSSVLNSEGKVFGIIGGIGCGNSSFDGNLGNSILELKQSSQILTVYFALQNAVTNSAMGSERGEVGEATVKSYCPSNFVAVSGSCAVWDDIEEEYLPSLPGTEGSNYYECKNPYASSYIGEDQYTEAKVNCVN